MWGDGLDAEEKKAHLISEGKIFIPQETRLPFPLSKSTAGPGAGSAAIALGFGGTRVKLAVNREPSRFSLALKASGGYAILDGGKPFIENVQVLKNPAHAPEQCFVNIHSHCIFKCAFCNSPRIREAGRKPEQVADFIVKTCKENDFRAVAITSAVPETIDKQADEFIFVIREVRKTLPDVIVGVEPYAETREQIRRLKEAGADEIKLNIQAATPEILAKVCPGFDYEKSLALIADAVQVFGKGKVTSNIIFGLGESDADVLKCAEKLAAASCIPTLRALRVNDLNRASLKEALGFEPEAPSPERILRLAEAQKKIMEKYGLTTKSMETMCCRCLCCDIVPFYDL
ncbi:MAG: biotin synthase [Thermoplasmata archaeon HGW-Thermoplasmata-2]|nr:MAG: biotin synthase [Thermoplasmata archaeon HGW-Thermoplasmata-2]